MRYIKWAIIILFWGTIAAVLNYTLPQHDVVRISDTYEKRIDPGENSLFWSVQDVGSDPNTSNRDVFFIQTRKTNGKVMVYRNEDTGWGWPPYFKLNSSNLQAEAVDLKSTADAPRWVVVRHYGWRSEFLSIFPNAVKIWAVADPEARITPWFNIIFLTIFFALIWAIWVRWRRFREARVDPMLENMEDGLYAAGDAIEERSTRFKRWLGSWQSK